MLEHLISSASNWFNNKITLFIVTDNNDVAIAAPPLILRSFSKRGLPKLSKVILLVAVFKSSIPDTIPPFITGRNLEAIFIPSLVTVNTFLTNINNSNNVAIPAKADVVWSKKLDILFNLSTMLFLTWIKLFNFSWFEHKNSSLAFLISWINLGSIWVFISSPFLIRISDSLSIPCFFKLFGVAFWIVFISIPKAVIMFYLLVIWLLFLIRLLIELNTELTG